MLDHPSNAVKEPLLELRQRQIDLENWCRNVGADRVLAPGWEKGAANCLADRIAAIYLKKVRELQKLGMKRPGKAAHIWSLMHSDIAVDHVAIESLLYVLTSSNEDRPFNQVASMIGKRAEYVLWLTHPSWGRSQHLRALKLASNNDLGMKLIIQRLRDKGFDKAADYTPLTRMERAAVGAFFLECIVESTHLIEIGMQTTAKGKRRIIRPTTLFWEFQSRWRDAAKLFRPVRLPMLVPPKSWTGHDDGGYLTQVSPISTVAWEQWPATIRHATPCVLASLNALQRVPHTLDGQQLALTQAVWSLGHAIGSLPRRDRLDEPVDAWYREQGLGPSAYWKAVWKWKSDQRRNPARSSFINGVIACEKLADAQQLYFVWTMDHRGRCYAKGAQINPASADHHRSLLQFQQRSPIKGHEKQFAWSIAGAYGLPSDWKVRHDYLKGMSQVIDRCGADPLGNLAYIEQAKDPWKFMQLARDWHCYQDNPGYTSGTIHWLDQTCSGWGHVACLTGDGTLAKFTNVTGDRYSDLYAGLGWLVEGRIEWLAKQPQEDERYLKCLEWWRDHPIPRSLWKSSLMPVIYGRSYRSLAETISLYLRDEIEDFLTDQGLPVMGLARTLASVINNVINEALPNVKEVSKWLRAVADLQMDAGQRPHWRTPNGMTIECWATDTEKQRYELRLSGRVIHINMREYTGKGFNRRAVRGRLVPDYVHSQDAAFLQRFVSHWQTYDHPITTVHDCFGTTLENVGTMRKELMDQWHRFYSVDYMTQHQGMVAMELDQLVPDPPIVGTLDRGTIGENPFLFC